jgi:hypothetical protein
LPAALFVSAVFASGLAGVFEVLLFADVLDGVALVVVGLAPGFAGICCAKAAGDSGRHKRAESRTGKNTSRVVPWQIRDRII